MRPEPDPEFECVALRRWRTEDARQDTRLLRKAWQAIVRSHLLLARPVYGAAGPRPVDLKAP